MSATRENKTSVGLKQCYHIKRKIVLMCHNKLSISTKIHFRAHNTASSITNKGRDHSSQQPPSSTSFKII